MDIKEAELLDGDIAAHWYYRAKLAALRRMLGGADVREVLDVGAGMGFFSRALLQAGNVASATCVDSGYEGDHDEAAGGKPLRFRRQVGRSTADLVLMMDVLEHVPDDVALLREYGAKVAPGTQFLVTVPAFNFLWSGHDVFLEHHRRYTLRGIERAVRAAGLHVDSGCYFYGGLFPLVAASRLKDRFIGRSMAQPRSGMRNFGAFLNTVFWQVCRAETAVFRANRLAGLTAFVRATKP